MEYLILLTEIVGLGGGFSGKPIARVKDFFPSVAADGGKFPLFDFVFVDRFPLFDRGVLRRRDQRFRREDGKGLFDAAPHFSHCGGGRFLCVDGDFSVLPDFARSLVLGDGEVFLGWFCWVVVCGRFGHARALVLRSCRSGAGLRKSGAIPRTQKSACRQYSLALEIHSAE